MTTQSQSSTYGLHNPQLGAIRHLGGGIVAVELGVYPITATLFFEGGLADAEAFANNLLSRVAVEKEKRAQG